MCVVSNEGENRIKHSEVFERDCKLEDIAGFIIDKFKLLKCDYVIIDPLGIGVVVNDILKDEFGDKVKIYESYALEQNKMIEILSKSKILKELGLELKCGISGAGLYKFNRKEYTDFEYLMVKSIGMANKLLNEIEKYKPETMAINCEVLIEDLSKEFEKLVSNSYKDMANSWLEGFKDNNIKPTVNTDNDLSEIKERLLSDLNHALEVIKEIDKIK